MIKWIENTDELDFVRFSYFKPMKDKYVRAVIVKYSDNYPSLLRITIAKAIATEEGAAHPRDYLFSFSYTYPNNNLEELKFFMEKQFQEIYDLYNSKIGELKLK